MNTLYLGNNEKDIETAANIIANGGLVAMPTETVYGLSANALSGKAVEKIFLAKGRPMDNPLIVHIAEIDDIEKFNLVSEFPEKARLLAEKFWPGPLTIIMKKSDVIPVEVSAGLDTVAIRLPSHKTARELIKKSNTVLAAPSANRSGSPSPTSAQHVMNDLSDRIDAVIDGGECAVGVESTVITLAADVPRILRPGYITLEDIESVIGHTEVDNAVLMQIEKNAKVSSPGMKYKHYSPKAKVILVKGESKRFVDFVNRKYEHDKTVCAICYDNEKEYLNSKCITIGSESNYIEQAHNLFSSLRDVDTMDDVKTVYAHCPKTDGISMALYNRLIRAAAFEVIDLSFNIVGLTGPTGSGKSEVAKVFKELGFYVIDADKTARDAVKDRELLDELAKAFSNEILDENGNLLRKKLAEFAFSTQENTEKLNSITHPKIMSLIRDEAYKKSNGNKNILLDAPTLFEAGADKICTTVICVLSDSDKRKERIISRDNLSEKDADIRQSAQKDDKFFTSKSDFVIHNNSSLDDLKSQAEKIIRKVTI